MTDLGERGKITVLLKALGNGDRAAEDQLMRLVYPELKRMAKRYLRNAGSGETLQTTALVHEAYLRLVHIDKVDWQDRVHFFGELIAPVGLIRCRTRMKRLPELCQSGNR